MLMLLFDVDAGCCWCHLVRWLLVMFVGVCHLLCRCLMSVVCSCVFSVSLLMAFADFCSLDDGVAFCCALMSLCAVVLAVVVVVLLWCLVLMFVSGVRLGLFVLFVVCVIVSVVVCWRLCGSLRFAVWFSDGVVSCVLCVVWSVRCC